MKGGEVKEEIRAWRKREVDYGEVRGGEVGKGWWRGGDVEVMGGK